MSLSDKLTQENLKNILLTVYKKSREYDDIQVNEIVEDIKQQLLSLESSK